MYKDYFGLKELPFSIAPDPRYLFMSEQHREALAHLLYGAGESGGFVLVTGEVGTGKTTVCRCLLEQVSDKTDIAFIVNPRQTALELLISICEELRLSFDETSDSIKYYVDLLYSALLESHSAGRTTILIIDEAQNLSTDLLEQLRLLTNLETHNKKLLQLILLGQPELNEKLALREMRQLAQRITARYHLAPLSPEETSAYITHRLGVAAGSGDLFSPAAIKAVYKASGGIPRLINLLCDRSLLGVFAENGAVVNKEHVRQASEEVLGKPQGRTLPEFPYKFVTGVVALVAISWALAVNFRQPFNAITAIDFSFDRMFTNAYKNRDAPPPVILDSAVTTTAKSSRYVVTFPVALQQLLGYWPGQGDPRVTSCADLPGTLSCYRGQGGWESLAKINRPVLLPLKTESGETGYLVLERLAGEQALVRIGDSAEKMDLHRIGQSWSGEFLSLWQKPDGYNQPLEPGSDGDMVAWLKQQLDDYYNETFEPVTVSTTLQAQNRITDKQQTKFAYLANYVPQNTVRRKAALFDALMLGKVKRFQREQDLEVTGIVDPIFIMRLNQNISDAMQDPATTRSSG
jgi:general secretion pathway protein A